MNRLIPLVAALAVIGGCTPARQTRDTSADVNAGINIVPPAVLASEKITPSTQPTVEDRPDLISALSSAPQHHEMFLRALRLSGLVPELRDKGPYTLLAPTDEAFAKLPPGAFDRLLQPARHDQLERFINYHLLTGRVLFKQMLDTNGQVSTVAGPKLIVRGIDDKVMINDANVLRSDNNPSNGVIHWIDGVLLPPA